MRRSIKIIIFLLVIMLPFIFLFKDKDQTLPITLHTITYKKDFFTGEGGTYFLPETVRYMGSITINKDKTITYSIKSYNKFLDYKVIVEVTKSMLEQNSPCSFKKYYTFRPIKTRSDDIIEKGPYQILYNGDKFTYKGGWIKTTKTYFPSEKFFQCLYEESYIIDPKIGLEYEENGWETEQHRYELISALLAKDNDIIVQGYDGKYYSVPKEIKRHVKEWQKTHPSPVTNKD